MKLLIGQWVPMAGVTHGMNRERYKAYWRPFVSPGDVAPAASFKNIEKTHRDGYTYVRLHT